MIESLLSATQQHPWLWGVYIFTVGLPVILFISFMWPDKRFGPPDQQYYYLNSDDAHPGDPQLTQGLESGDNKGNDDRAALRKRGTKKKSDLDLKHHR
ncbi:unnamed protein product [Tetraodon nigroviridis]|uniref:(spotted green pufferfish) hypothetical protein n=1 Tax=Tetraodon nigroviridis TaxID=99883 RepID=Q4SFA5_TETNG|nr:unnamed protein product [Tetraodon nigroviridis]